MEGWQEAAAECLESLTDMALDSVSRADSAAAIDPTVLLFLLQRYAATDRGDLRDALGSVLAAALASLPAVESGSHKARWLTVFAEAGAMSHDVRLFTAASGLDGELRARWRSGHSIAAAAESVEACLVSASAAGSRDLLQSAVDELEHVVGASYRPGHGVGPGRLADQIGAASALLTAFALTGRLPYSMLAEELMQVARRTLWDARDGGFFDAPPSKPFTENCEAARVCCRLESLHRDDEYRRAAVLAGATTYVQDAELALASQSANLAERGPGAALYGIALTEWLHLKDDLK